MERVQVRVALPTEQGVPKMAGVVCEQIELRIAPPEPPRQEIDRQREPAHLGEQRDDERGEHAESASPGVFWAW
jgi:hypothetical protein